MSSISVSYTHLSISLSVPEFNFGTGINSIVSKLNSGTDKDMLASVWIPSLAAIIFVTANLFYGIRKHRSMYTAYLVVYLILNTSFDWVISVPRYMTCAIPALDVYKRQIELR